MQEINLLKSQYEDKSFAWERRNRVLIIVLTLILLAELVLSGLFFLYNKSTTNKLNVLRNQNLQVQNKFNEEQNKLGPAKAFQAQLKNLTKLMDGHIYMSKFWDELSPVTYKQVQYKQVTIDIEGKVYIEGQVNTYTDLAKFMLGLSTSENFYDLRLLSTSPTDQSANLTFTVEMKLNPELLKQK